MKRWNKLVIVAVLLFFFTGLSSGVIALGAKDCLLLVNQFLTLEPQDATLTSGDVLTAHIKVFAKQGAWRLFVSAQTESLGFVADRANFWELDDGEKRVLDVRIRITDAVSPGLYNLRFIVNATPIAACDGFTPVTSIFSTNVRVKGISALDVQDNANDAFDAQTGDSVDLSSVSGVDIQQVGVERTDKTLLFAVQTDGRLPASVEDAQQRIGCYLDLNGDAALGVPFSPEGFEFLLLSSWQSQDPFAQLIDLKSGQLLSGLSSKVTLNSLFMSVELAALGSPDVIHWVCFSEYSGGSGRAIDLAPDQNVEVI